MEEEHFQPMYQMRLMNLSRKGELLIRKVLASYWMLSEILRCFELEKGRPVRSRAP